MSAFEVVGWDRLRHGGLLLDAPRLRRVAEHAPNPLPPYEEHELRRLAIALPGGSAPASDFVTFVLEKVCGFTASVGSWQRGSQVAADWGRRTVTGETAKPRQLWRGENGAILPVFFDGETRLGIGRGRKAASQAVQWLRAGTERLALLTNGRQWRLIFAGLDFDAWCEWDVDLWFAEGGLSPQVQVLRTLLQPALWTPPAADTPAPLLQAIIDSRKGQAELSAVLGERVREAVELLVQAHGEILKERCDGVDPADIYRAAVRVVMRLVVVLFAESRELLPRDNALYHGAYGLSGLLEDLDKVGARGGNRLARSWNAWPRVLALFRLVHQGSHHPALPVPAYGGELFAPGDPASADGLSKALAVFETAAFDRELLSDRDVHKLLERITRTKVKIRQGRANTWVPAPVDFSDLSSEYIGILYEGLLDFELKTAPQGDPVIFLAVGSQPGLPLSRLEAMDDKALASLLEKMKDTSKSEGDDEEESEDAEPAEEETADENEDDGDHEDITDAADDRHATRTRAEVWARRAVEAGKLARKPRGAITPEKRLEYEYSVARKARQLVIRVILPGEWYVVRWGGTRKGSGTFYTRPGLAVPTVQRTLRPLAYMPPFKDDGSPDFDATQTAWTPKTPDEILALKVCDPACGSGTFPVAALRFLTDALFASLHHHGRVSADGERAVVRLLEGVPTNGGTADERLGQELLPCRPDDSLFEPRLKAILRRHVVERSIYGVDLDPLAVELCRLALWIETMDRTLPFSFLDHKVKCGNALVGAWFDQFQHYPVMAWKNREGGDKNHTNGVHFEKDSRTRAIKAFVKDKLTPDLVDAIVNQRRVLLATNPVRPLEVHAHSLATVVRLHELPVQDAAERARIYRAELAGSSEFQALKSAMDVWCACWFWPADELDAAPLPTNLAAPTTETTGVAARVAARNRFFHWELEFPDVFRAAGSGFDAILGNPPWDIAKPNSKEFFSNIDPLYRSYGKQDALRCQTAYFSNERVERDWLDYNASFRALSNAVSYSASPFGDPSDSDSSGDSFAIVRGKSNAAAHTRWRAERSKSAGFADPAHPFRHQGSADLNLYKLFLEQAHVLLRSRGRLGFIVPSGLYSDHGTGGLRRLFLDRCRWEWLFGFENRDKVFEIDSRFKFNPVIIEKGGKTEAIRAAFMRRKLEDWESAEALATPYTRAQVERFSPRSKAILEIQSSRDLEILEKIYANSVLLGDEGPDGWGIKYATEFHMTNDSKLFPPRPKWEADGYRPDEYSRWLKGNWRPIAELWAELGVKSLPEGERRCAQPPYDTLPIPRADIPMGILFSREADAWIHEQGVSATALPLWQGVLVHGLSSNAAGYEGGAGHRARWRRYDTFVDDVHSQFLLGIHDVPVEKPLIAIGFRALARATDERTLICCVLDRVPCGNSVGLLSLAASVATVLFGTAVSASLVFDWSLRRRIAGTNVNSFFLWETGWPRRDALATVVSTPVGSLALASRRLAPLAMRAWRSHRKSWKMCWAATAQERLRVRCMLDAVVAALFGLSAPDLRHILSECDRQDEFLKLASDVAVIDARGFWRVDKNKDPELRHTVLTLIAFDNLEKQIGAHGGDLKEGIKAFFEQNDGEGWMLPEQLRLADYGLGHDQRAHQPQPVASRLGSRFYDWQVAQTVEESWRECHLHARNLLGEDGYRQLLADLAEGTTDREPIRAKPAPARSGPPNSLFD